MTLYVKKGLASASLLAGLLMTSAAYADLPESAKALFAGTKVDAAAVEKAAETELKLPADWLEKAEKEGTVLYNGGESPEVTDKYLAPFKERYPNIKIEVTDAVGAARAVKPLLAWQAGQPIADVVTGFGSSIQDYYTADALEEINDLPAFAAVPEESRDSKNRWAGYTVAHSCLVYNTDRVKPEELPKTWWDLVSADSPLKNGRVGVANRAHLWVINLWKEFGEDKVKNEYLPAFFGTLKPQLRKEGLAAMVKLVAIGEFDVGLPADESDVADDIAKGAKVAYHCLDIVPQRFAELGMFRKSEHEYASKILINWILSMEGQAARQIVVGATPIHKDMRDDKYLPFPDEVLKNKISVRTLDMMVNDLPKVYEAWNAAWQAAGGPANN